MRAPVIAAWLLAVACHPSTRAPVGPVAGSGSATGSGSDSRSGSATGSGSAAGPRSGSGSHELPAAAIAALAAYGPPHGAPIDVPAVGKDGEHWLAFVGGDTALSAWLVTPGDPAHLLTAVADWPTGTRVTGGVVEVGDRGLGGDPAAATAYVLVESRAGMGQAAGMRGVVRIAIPPAGAASVVDDDQALVALAGVAEGAALGARLDALAADAKATRALLPDERESFAATLRAPDAAALAALLPASGVVVATAQQHAFVARVFDLPAATADELAPLLANRAWFCAAASCTDGDVIAVLGAERGHVVIRAIVRPSTGSQLTAELRAVAPPGDPAPVMATAHALGMLDAKVVAVGATHDGWTAIVTSAGSDLLLSRDGDVVAQTSVDVDARNAQAIRFADIDGDGVAEAALPRQSESGEAYTVFIKASGQNDVGAGIAAIGAKTPDDAVARALAMPAQPVTPQAACALLVHITSAGSLAKAGAPAVYAFTEPGQPEVRHEKLGAKAAAASLHAAFKDGCDLVCDPIRPICHTTEAGPGITYHLFREAGGTLRLVAATVYRGS